MGMPVAADTLSDAGVSCGKGGIFRIAGAPKVSATTTDVTTGLSHATVSLPGKEVNGGRLARVTAYWPSEGDYYTRHRLAATGVRLHDGHCAVDPNIIPYGSVVAIAGVGTFLAVDTPSAMLLSSTSFLPAAARARPLPPARPSGLRSVGGPQARPRRAPRMRAACLPTRTGRRSKASSSKKLRT